jgi:two-component system response regulator ChvI
MIPTKDPAPPLRVVVIDDDDLYRETLRLRLARAGYEVTSFSGGVAALDHFASGSHADVLLLDWRMPGMNGLEMLHSLRRTGNTTPVIFLTALNEGIYEEAALEGGAVDFIDKSRSLSILVKRLLIAARMRPAAKTDGAKPDEVLQIGRLELRFDTSRARWSGTPVDLTLTEFKVVALLAQRAGEDVPYREIYDLARGNGAMAGDGGEDYRASVRALVKRIRRKFSNADPAFAHIVNYIGFGYRYHGTP